MSATPAERQDPQSEPHVQDIENDPPPSKGTNEPWKRPGQASQNPDEPEPGKKRDVDRPNNSASK